MSETQARTRVDYQPSHERLAFLLEQLSELDPEGEKRARLEAASEKKSEPRARFEAVAPPRPKLEPVPIRRAEQVIAQPPAPVQKQEALPPQPPVVKPRAKKAAVRKTPVSAKAAPRTAVKSKAKSKPVSKLKQKAHADSKSFNEIMRGYAKAQGRLSPRAQTRLLPPPPRQTPWDGFMQRGLPALLARTWSWLNSRVKTSNAKRLRLSEVVQLGEKRFVALVKVEDREFLIGGASTGLSLLSPLEAAGGTVTARKRGIGAGGKSR